jgi:hypothetical protein
MKPAKILYLLADDEIKATVRELIGPQRHAKMLAEAVFENTQETLDTKALAKLLKISERGARKRKKKAPPETRQ